VNDELLNKEFQTKKLAEIRFTQQFIQRRLLAAQLL